METRNKVSDLVAEYLADRNCRADLWIDDCLNKGEVSKEERDEFLLIVMVTTWERAYALYTPIEREKRLRDLLDFDFPMTGSDIERIAKITALQNLQRVSA